MAGCKLSPKMRWQDVRAQVKTSEGYFRQFANDRGLTETVAQGRKTLGEEASRNLPAIRQKCPEFNDLANKLEKHLAS